MNLMNPVFREMEIRFVSGTTWKKPFDFLTQRFNAGRLV